MKRLETHSIGNDPYAYNFQMEIRFGNIIRHVGMTSTLEQDGASCMSYSVGDNSEHILGCGFPMVDIFPYFGESSIGWLIEPLFFGDDIEQYGEYYQDNLQGMEEEFKIGISYRDMNKYFGRIVSLNSIEIKINHDSDDDIWTISVSHSELSTNPKSQFFLSTSDNDICKCFDAVFKAILKLMDFVEQ